MSKAGRGGVNREILDELGYLDLSAPGNVWPSAGESLGGVKCRTYDLVFYDGEAMLEFQKPGTMVSWSVVLAEGTEGTVGASTMYDAGDTFYIELYLDGGESGTAILNVLYI